MDENITIQISPKEAVYLSEAIHLYRATEGVEEQGKEVLLDFIRRFNTLVKQKLQEVQQHKRNSRN